MSPSLAPSFFQIKLRLLRGEYLAKMDNSTMFNNGGINAYVKLVHGGVRYRTRVIDKEADKETDTCGPCDWN